MGDQLSLFGAPPPPPVEERDPVEEARTLEELEEIALSCQRCPLAGGRRHVVFGEGNPKASLLLVGEGPGEREDELGRPFVGRAGELLDRILLAAGFPRSSVYITNVVMCRPPGNRIPTEKEISACHPYLRRKIALIRPLVVLCLGSTSARALIDREARITQIRGRWFHREGIYYLATYHPAAVLRDVTKKRPVWEDFLKVKELLKRV